jgi:mono/diheme cytochrome c family protein
VNEDSNPLKHTRLQNEHRASPGTLLAMFAVALVTTTSTAQAQTADSTPRIRSTMTGVYSAEQATRGVDTYSSVCASCHTIEEQTGLNFSKKWVGFPLFDLYSYLLDTMPQDDPGSLTPQEYAQVVAYILKLNGMPEGKEELPPDTLTLRRIKVDTVKVDTVKVDTTRARPRIPSLR